MRLAPLPTYSGVPRALRPVLTAIACAIAALLLLAPEPSKAALTLQKNAPPTVLLGSQSTVTLNATNTASGPYGYNLTFRDVLPAGVSYVADSARFGGAPVEPTVIANAPAAGQTTLIFSNVADISINSSQSVTYRVAHTATGVGAFQIGQSYVNQATAYANTNPRIVPSFGPTGAPVASGSGMTSNTGQATTQVSAIQIEKSEPNSEGEIMRGVHDHQTVYTLRVTNNGIHPTTGITVDDYLPAGLEFLGCGTVDNTSSAPTNLGSTEEYPGSGAIDAAGNRPSGLNGTLCRTPALVETIQADGSATQPDELDAGAVYTHVRWTGLGVLQPGETIEIQYVAAVPLRENTVDWSTETAETGGTTPATTGAQTANLDNNSGPETRDEQTLRNHAVASGVYRGDDPNPALRLDVQDTTTLTRTAEDLAVAKTVDPGEIRQNGISEWRLRFRTSEYRRVTDAAVTDTLPDGLCPLGSVNHERTPPTASSECNPVSGQTPSLAYESVVENADGSWTIDWTLPDLAPSAEYDVTFPTRTRRFYQENFANDAANPVRAGDSWTNSVDVTGDDHRICIEGDADCADSPAVRIDGDGPNSRTVVDTSSASQTSGGISIDKTVLDPTASGVPTPISCTAAQTANPDAYVDESTVPTYGAGDRICWRLRVDFSSTVDTGEPEIRDFIPAGLSYDAGSAQPTSRNTIAGLTVDDSAAASDRVLAWQLADVDTANQVFEWVFSTTVSTSVIPVNAEQTVTGNLMKLAYRNTGGETFSLRDRVEAEVVRPVVGLVKDVTLVSPAGNATISGGNATNVGVGSNVNYRVRLSNGTSAAAQRTVVWDNLPAGVTCADVVPMSISDGGVCAQIPLTSSYRITWSPGVTVPAEGPTGAAGIKDLTYTVVAPQGQRPAATLTNTAGVVQYARDTNGGGSETFVPANNIDPTRTVTNSPRADDPASITLRDLTLAKSVVTTSVDAAGNNATSQATIGETIDYRVQLTVPAGTTLFGTPTLTDTVNARMELLATPAPAISQSGGSAVTTAPTVSANGNTLTATFAGPYVNSGDTNAVFTLTFRARVRDATTPTNANRRGQQLPNSATLAWRLNSGDTTNTTRTSNTSNVTIVEPNLTIGKVAALTSDLTLQTSTVSAGDGVRYTVYPRNASGSNVSASHETVTVDTVPVGITPRKTDGAPVTATGDQVGLSGYPIGTWNATARTITWSHGTLTPGADPIMVYEADVDSPAPAGLVLTNTATVTGSSLSGSDANERTATSGFNTGYTATATRPLTVQGGTLTKSAVSPRATVGDLIDYTVEYTLPPNVTFYDLLFNDYLPDGVEYVPGSVQTACLPACTFAGTAAAPNAIAMPGRSIVSGQAQHGFFLDDIPAAPTARTVRLTYQGRITKDYFVAASGAVEAGDVLTNNVDVLYNATNKQTAPLTGFPNLLNFDQRSAQVPASVIVTEPRIALNKHVSGIPTGNDSDRRDTVPGDDYTYTVTVTNTGTSPAYDVQVTDTPSDKLTNVTATAGGVSPSGSATVVDGDGDDGSLAWEIPGPLAPGASVTLTYTADLVGSSELSANETVVNTATVPSYWNASEAERTADPADGFREYTANPPTDTVTLDVRLPNVTVQKTTGVSGFPEAANAEIGESFPWRVVITNPSPSSTAHDVEISDILPAGWSYDEDSAAFAPAPSVPGFDPEPTVTTLGGRDSLSWANIGDIAPGGQVVLTFTATPDLASKPSPNPQQNTVAAAARDSDGEAGSADGPYADDDTADANLRLPVLTVAKTPDGANATAGTTANYSVVVRNTSTNAPARDVEVTDVLQAHQSYTAGAATASPATGFSEIAPVVDEGDEDDPDDDTTTIGWRIASIPAGGSVTITVPVAIPDGLAAGTTLRNGVSVVSREITEPVTDDGSLTTTVDGDVGVEKTITAPGGALVPGQNVTYSIEATNHGPSVATGIEVSDVLPDALTLVSAPGCAVNRQTLTCEVGTLAVGDSETFTVTATIDSAATGTLSNTAWVDSTTPDSVTTNDSSTAARGLSPEADLEVTKTVSDASLHQGDEFTYEIKVRNDGPSDAVNVTLADPLPAPGIVLATTAPTTDKGTCTPTASTNTVNCALGTLAPDETATVTVTARAVNVGTFNNEATAATTTAESSTTNNQDDVDVTVDPVADVGIEKTAAATVAANDTLTYTLRLFNEGPSPATDVVVTDELPEGVEYVSASPGCTHVSGVVTCELANLPVSGSDPADDPTVEITVRVPWALADATLANTATIEADELDRNDDNDSSTATTIVDPVADLEVTKTVSDASLHQGDEFTYTVTVRNDGPSDAANVTLTDTMPSGIVLADADPTTDKGTCTTTTNTVNCALGTLEPDETATVTITARAVDVGTATNVATAATATADPNLDNNEDDVDVEVEPVADVGIEKTAAATVDANDNLTYTLRVSNDGPSPATGVVVTDELPAGVDYVSSSSECAITGRTVRCELDSVPVSGDPADDPELTITVHVPWTSAGTTLSNTAGITADELDRNEDNDESTATTEVGPAANLKTTKTAPTLPVPQTVPFEYQVTVENQGPSTAVDVRLSDAMPNGVSALEAESEAGTCTVTATQVDCELGDLAVGESVTVTITARGDLPGTPLNTATATSDTPEVDPTDDADDAEVTILAASDVGVVKSAPTQVDGNDELTYGLKTTNHGPSDATGVTVTDPLPAGVEFRSASDGCTLTGRTVTCAIGDLADGDSVDHRITVFVPNELGGQKLTNIASVAVDQVDLNQDNDSSQVETTVGDVADLAITKVAGAAAAGGKATWVVTVINNGPTAAEAVVVRDDLPVGTTFDVAQPSVGNCSGSGREVYCNLGTIAAGGSAQVTIVADVAANAGDQTLRNVATVASPTPDPDNGNNVAAADVVVSPLPPTSPDLRVTKTASTSRPVLGRELTYRIQVTNVGGVTANDVRMTDTMNRSVRINGINAQQGRCTIDGSSANCELGAIAPGQTVTVDVRVTPQTPGDMSNTVSVQAVGQAEPQVTDNVAVAGVRVNLRRAAATVRKTASKREIRGGQRVTYTITVKMGKQAGSNVKVCDRLPRGLTFVRATGARFSKGQACWTVPYLGAGKTKKFRIVARAERSDETRTIRNRAVLTGRNVSRRTASATVKVTPALAARPGGVTG